MSDFEGMLDFLLVILLYILEGFTQKARCHLCTKARMLKAHRS